MEGPVSVISRIDPALLPEETFTYIMLDSYVSSKLFSLKTFGKHFSYILQQQAITINIFSLLFALFIYVFTK
jgi:hypothetical protein